MASQWWLKSKKKSNKETPKKLFEALSGSGEIPDLETAGNETKSPEKKYQERVLFQTQRIEGEQKEIYSREQRETRREIEALHQEVELLAQETNNLEKDLDLAVQQNIVDPSAYNLSFLKRLSFLIRQFREKIEDASIWLEAWNQKGKKRNFFWGMVTSKKGGSQFLLSGESYASRSAG